MCKRERQRETESYIVCKRARARERERERERETERETDRQTDRDRGECQRER